MAALTLQYLEEHLLLDAEFKNFGKLVVDTLIKSAIQQLNNSTQNNAEIVNINLQFSLKASDEKDCIRICMKDENNRSWCIHQLEDNIEEA